MSRFTDFISFPAAPVWEAATGVQPTPDIVGTVNTVFGPSGNIRALAFSVGDSISGQIRISHTYQEGTDIESHVNWSPINTDTGFVKWSLDYYWLNIGETAIGAPTTIVIEQAGGGVAWNSQLASFPTISGAGKLISSLFMFRLSRVLSTVPAIVGNPVLLSFDIHYLRDSVGSRMHDVK